MHFTLTYSTPRGFHSEKMEFGSQQAANIYGRAKADRLGKLGWVFEKSRESKKEKAMKSKKYHYRVTTAPFNSFDLQCRQADIIYIGNDAENQGWNPISNWATKEDAFLAGERNVIKDDFVPEVISHEQA